MMAEDDSSGKTRLRRTRTGCLKCRVRRRKCDEKKPTCQRCVDGGFDCQYGTRLSFLDKNAITADATKLGKRQAYSTLRFVDTRHKSSKSPAASPKQSQRSAGLSIGDITNSSVAETDTSLNEFQPPPTPTYLDSSTPRAASFECPPPVLNNPGPGANESSPSNTTYETALNVLLSLGTGAGQVNTAAIPTPGPREGVGDYFAAFPTSHFDPPAAVATPIAELSEQFSTCALLPQDKVVQLLRHYRYNIAPWLDVGDPAQTFGLEVSRLAMSSSPLLESLLSLSSISLNRYAEVDIGELVQAQVEDPEISLVDSLIIIAFAGVKQFAASTPNQWQSPFSNISLGALDAALSHSDFFAVQMGVSWVMLRLDVSVGLLNSSPVSIPSLLSFGVTSPAASQLFHESLKFDREPVLLCAQVLNYCFGHDSASAPEIQLGLGTTHRWKVLFESLMMWYNSRPRDFRPMLELEENEQLFPLILFSSGTATLANQIFHTAMLLLLQNQPRTLLNELGRSVTMSPLWHAQRICGISLNNDGRNSWDFSMIGSLFVGARRMTYEPQQRVILAGIERIARITGWDLGSLTAQLIQEWPPE